MARTAPVHEMIGGAGNARRARTAPVIEELLVEMVAAFGRLDEDEARIGFRTAVQLISPCHFDTSMPWTGKNFASRTPGCGSASPFIG